MPSARRVHSLLKLTSYFNFEVGGVHTISKRQRRTRAAHDLLASVRTQFTEGFGTRDLVNATMLLEDMTTNKSGTR
jgi:hypothetical protein